MAITISGSGTISGISAGGLPNGSVTAATLATNARPLFTSYALLTDQKDGAADGGGSTANTWTKRTLNLKVVDADNIVTLNNSEFTLGVGTYYIKFFVPNYKGNTGISQLYHVDTASPVQTGIINMTTYTNSSYNGYQVSNNWARYNVASGTDTFYIRNYVDTALGTNGLGLNIPDDNADSSYYTTVEIFKEAE